MTIFLDTLNEKQKEAVLQTDGPVLVLAGAGTGKTRVLTARIAYILQEQKAWPAEILAMTFTNKAALEMKNRVAALLENQNIESMWLGTFHSIGVRILRRHGEHIGLNSNFTIIDSDDQERVLKKVLQLEGLDDKKQNVRLFAHMINSWKDRALTPDKVGEHHLGWDKARQVLHIYKLYQERLQLSNSVDFGDLLLLVLDLFLKHSNVLQEYLDRFRYLLVDEYQDTNVAQYLLLRLLAQGTGNICCVGDDDQSIYGWRGAEVGNILRFEQDFQNAKLIRLEQNYRSTPAILGAASGLIANNKSRLGKTLWTERKEEERILVKGLFDAKQEAFWVTDQVLHFRNQGISLSEMAILVRAGYQTREFEEVLLMRSIPYKIVGGLRFYERMEIRDALAYLRLIVQPKDDLAFERIINLPKRGLGQTTLKKMHLHAQEQKICLLNAAQQMVEMGQIKGRAQENLRHFLRQIDNWRTSIETLEHTELVKKVLEESGYLGMWKSDNTLEATGRLENLKELLRAIEPFSNLNAFLEHVSLVMDNLNTVNAHDTLTLMSMHASKGLEFDITFLTGWEEGVFPSQKSLEETGAGLEEERRLAYVALTRAKKKAHITFASSRQVHGQWQNNMPSRFIKEIPEECVSFETAHTSRFY